MPVLHTRFVAVHTCHFHHPRHSRAAACHADESNAPTPAADQGDKTGIVIIDRHQRSVFFFYATQLGLMRLPYDLYFRPCAAPPPAAFVHLFAGGGDPESKAPRHSTASRGVPLGALDYTTESAAQCPREERRAAKKKAGGQAECIAWHGAATDGRLPRPALATPPKRTQPY